VGKNLQNFDIRKNEKENPGFVCLSWLIVGLKFMKNL
jgi:hypothetical protein